MPNLPYFARAIKSDQFPFVVQHKQSNHNKNNITIMFRGDTVVEENWESFHSRHSGDYLSQVTKRSIIFDPDDHDHPKRRNFGFFRILLSCTSAEAVVIGGPPASPSYVLHPKHESGSYIPNEPRPIYIQDRVLLQRQYFKEDHHRYKRRDTT